MSALICGSVAYDTIMMFHDKFKHHILPEQVPILNVCFLVPTMRREYGGCAGNIAYNLKLLGEQPLIMATVGHDFEPYAKWLSSTGLSSRYIKIIEKDFTGQAYITTDEDNNQITAFHPGAMNSSHLNSVPTDANISLGIVAPDGKDGMLQHAAEFSKANIKFIFDPGQGLPMFNSDELLNFMQQATWAIFNGYEAELIQKLTGLSLTDLAKKVKALIVTHGSQGSKIYTNNQIVDIPSAQPSTLNDPTGCGDAYRAGLMFGLMKGNNWEKTGRIASLMGAIKIEYHGTQNHHFTLDDFKQRYHQNFGLNF
jgi:adenosine kinase